MNDDIFDVDEEIETLTDDEIPVENPVIKTPSRSASIFTHPEAHPYAISLFLLKRYGPEWLEWEPETLRRRVDVDYRSTISTLNFHKIQAVKTLNYVESFWTNWEVFVPCVMAFNNLLPDFEIMQVPTVAQCAVAIDVANRIRVEKDWSDEILTFLQTLFRYEGLLVAIDVLEFVPVDQDGYEEEAKEISLRWPLVRASKQLPQGDGLVNDQLRRLFDIHGDILESHQHLTSQLGMLLHA